MNKALFKLSFGLGGVGMLGYQLYHWLRYAEWESFSLLWPLSYLPRFEDWVYYPDEWLGVHKVLEYIPFAFVLIFISFLLVMYEEVYA